MDIRKKYNQLVPSNISSYKFVVYDITFQDYVWRH